MLKLIAKSANKKLGGCAATYRSGANNVYGTCPGTCDLMPAGQRGSGQIDREYLDALLNAVPEDGVSWTYTHFSWAVLPFPEPGKTVINVSADDVEEALDLFSEGYPVVLTVPKERDSKVEDLDSVKLVRCPAEYREEVTCSNCGGNKEPLCARGDRHYIIKFTAHGTQQKKVGAPEKGGCYGSGGNVAIQWKNTMTKNANASLSDAEALTNWVKTLPKGTYIRHHVVGDVGRD